MTKRLAAWRAGNDALTTSLSRYEKFGFEGTLGSAIRLSLD
jgi:hypothetical protein